MKVRKYGRCNHCGTKVFECIDHMGEGYVDSREIVMDITVGFENTRNRVCPNCDKFLGIFIVLKENEIIDKNAIMECHYF